MQLIDSHAHIDFPQFDADRDAMLTRAQAAGVTTLLAIGTGPGPDKLDAALPYAEARDWIYTTVGIHPHEAKQVTLAHLDTLARLARHPKVIAWGEIGLDYFYDYSPRGLQERVFRNKWNSLTPPSSPSSFTAAMPGTTAWPSSTKSGNRPA